MPTYTLTAQQEDALETAMRMLSRSDLEGGGWRDWGAAAKTKLVAVRQAIQSGLGKIVRGIVQVLGVNASYITSVAGMGLIALLAFQLQQPGNLEFLRSQAAPLLRVKVDELVSVPINFTLGNVIQTADFEGAASDAASILGSAQVQERLRQLFVATAGGATLLASQGIARNVSFVTQTILRAIQAISSRKPNILNIDHMVRVFVIIVSHIGVVYASAVAGANIDMIVFLGSMIASLLVDMVRYKIVGSGASIFAGLLSTFLRVWKAMFSASSKASGVVASTLGWGADALDGTVRKKPAPAKKPEDKKKTRTIQLKGVVEELEGGAAGMLSYSNVIML